MTPVKQNSFQTVHQSYTAQVTLKAYNLLHCSKKSSPDDKMKTLSLCFFFFFFLLTLIFSRLEAVGGQEGFKRITPMLLEQSWNPVSPL